MSTPSRPGLRFNSLDELLADVNQLHADGWTQSGQWSLAMIADHLARWTGCMLDGGLPRIPGPVRWIIRAVIGWMARKQKYPSFPLHAPSALKPVKEIAEQPAIDAFRAAVARLKQLSGPMVNTQPFGPLPTQDFLQMTLLHAAHHLSFLKPKTQAVRQS